jgi:uncharacterized protein (UPF0332 family)
VSEEIAGLLDKAERSIAAAGTLLHTGDADFAASRAYYAIFYTAEALLLSRGLSFSKHTGVHAAFGKHFAQSGELDSRYHRWLLEAFTARIAGDYGAEMVLEPGDVEETIRRAQEFLAAARGHLHGSDPNEE